MTNTGTRKLETLAIFPYIAWGTVIVFAFFVYNIAVELRVASENLKESSMILKIQERNHLPPLEDETATETNAATTPADDAQ